MSEGRFKRSCPALHHQGGAERWRELQLGANSGDDLKMVAKTVTVWPVSLDGCSLGGAAKATSAGFETSVGQEKMGRR